MVVAVDQIAMGQTAALLAMHPVGRPAEAIAVALDDVEFMVAVDPADLEVLRPPRVDPIQQALVMRLLVENFFDPPVNGRK